MMNPAYAVTHVATSPLVGVAASASRNAVAAILAPSDILLDLDVTTKDRALEEIAHATETHLLLLAEVADMFFDVSFREGLRACTNVDGIHAAFTQWRQP
jgi:mannitol/fructose-specific phosphotransferase system IIA component (Ntr-type)